MFKLYFGAYCIIVKCSKKIAKLTLALALVNAVVYMDANTVAN